MKLKLNFWACIQNATWCEKLLTLKIILISPCSQWNMPLATSSGYVFSVSRNRKEAGNNGMISRNKYRKSILPKYVRLYFTLAAGHLYKEKHTKVILKAFLFVRMCPF